MDNLKVGGSVWVYGDPFYRQWNECRIVGETLRSWVLDSGNKVPKKRKPELTGILYSRQEYDDVCFREKHVWSIGDAVRKCRDAEKLRQIAAIVGFEVGNG